MSIEWNKELYHVSLTKYNDMSPIQTKGFVSSYQFSSLNFTPKPLPTHSTSHNRKFKNQSPETHCMETLQILGSPPTEKPELMASYFYKLNRETLTTSLTRLKPFCTTTKATTTKTTTSSPPLTSIKTTPSKRCVKRVAKSTKIAVAGELKENWLHSLTYPFPDKKTECLNCACGVDLTRTNVDSNWVIGVDPDLSGALALVKINESGCCAEVFDAPHLKVMVGKRLRKRLDAKSIVQLLQCIDAPIGTTAYIEQSIPYPQDGKQGWWSGGFGYGLWIGILVASGFSVVPVPSFIWKSEFELTGDRNSKDESRKIASTLFPSLSSSLTRKKDHGRAEALLIAAYGKGLKIDSTLSCTLEELPQNLKLADCTSAHSLAETALL